MIQKTQAFKTSDGQAFEKISEAQQHELVLLLNPDTSALEHMNEIAVVLLANADKVVDILTTKPNSIAKARSVNGGRKPRRAVTVEAKP